MRTLTEYEVQGIELAIEHLQVLLTVVKRDGNAVSHDYIEEKLRRCKAGVSRFENSVRGGGK